ncbi:MAG: SGNH/GDSL hydrolase family protein [Clostridiales bacterium]|nr:SGNH/GDSL hydrolase family protein [Clostridiales bacterium]
MNIRPSDEKVKIMGRFEWKDNMLYLCYSGAYIEFIFSGSQLSVRMFSEFVREKESCMIAVFINGNSHSVFPLKEGMHDYRIIDFNETKTVIVRLMKISEEQYASSAVCNLITDDTAYIKPTGYLDRRIEFIGDSITCGYGNEGTEGDEFSTADENASKSYAVLTAQSLQADFSLISFSGIGITSRYVEPEAVEPLTDILMPEIYPYSDWYLDRRKGCEPAEKWDFNRFQAEIVVINLGTNDASYVRNNPDKKRRFIIKYAEFIYMVRRYNTNAEIICTIGVMESRLSDAVKKSVELYKEKTGDKRVVFFLQDMQLKNDGCGTAMHPSVRTHEKMAWKLTRFILDNNFWKEVFASHPF